MAKVLLEIGRIQSASNSQTPRFSDLPKSDTNYIDSNPELALEVDLKAKIQKYQRIELILKLIKIIVEDVVSVSLIMYAAIVLRIEIHTNYTTRNELRVESNQYL